jgi:dihydrofolate reductase
MGKVVVSQFITVDGVIEDPGGSEKTDRGAWAFEFERGEEGDKFKLDEVMAAGALLLGRKTWEGFAEAWPDRKDDMGFADKFNSMPKYVVSGTMSDEDATWNNSHVVPPGDLAGEVAKIKEAIDGDILVNGSIQLVHDLAAEGLVDEYRLMVFPTILGAGKKMFGDAEKAIGLKLTDTLKCGDQGVYTLTYQPA